MNPKMKLTAVFSKQEDGGYIAYIEEMPGVNSQGDNFKEARKNLYEALEMILQVRREIANKELQANKNNINEIIIEEIPLNV